MLRRTILALAFLALAPWPLAAQPTGRDTGYAIWAWDLTDTSYTYCLMRGQNGNPFGEPLLGTARIKTTGSSTSVTEVTAGSNPFTNLAVGDMILVRRGQTTDRVSIVTRTDAANVVVSSAVDWSAGYEFRWLDRSCGATTNDGWFSLGNYAAMQTTLEWTTKNATSLEMQTECATASGLPVIVNTTSATSAGQWPFARTATDGVYDRCRVGLKLTSDTGAQVVNATIALERDTSSTDGLFSDVSIGGDLTITGNDNELTLGSELTTNGSFTGSATGWTLGGGGGTPDWYYNSNNVCHASGGGTSTLAPNPAATIPGNTSEYSWVIVKVTLSSYTSGQFVVSRGGLGCSGVPVRDWNQQWTIVCGGASSGAAGNIAFLPTNDFAGCVDDISIKHVTQPSGARITFMVPADNGTTVPGRYRLGAPGIGNLRLGSQTTAPLMYGATYPLGRSNTVIGTGSMINLYEGYQNTGLGSGSCAYMGSGYNNTCLGFWAGYRSQVDYENTNVGAFSGWYNNGPPVYGNTNVGLSAFEGGSGDRNVCLGTNACKSGTHDASIGLGAYAKPSASNQWVVGASDAGLNISEAYIGSGVTKASPTAFTMRGTGGSGADNPGSTWNAAPGAGTGTAAGGDYVIQRSPSISTGSTVQTLVPAIYVRSQAKTLSDGVIATIFTITTSGAHARTGGSWSFCVEAGDASNDQVACCRAQWAMVDTASGAGGETCGVFLDKTCTAALEGASSSGTLSVTVATSTGTDSCNYRMTADSSLTPTTLRTTPIVQMNGTIGALSWP